MASIRTFSPATKACASVVACRFCPVVGGQVWAHATAATLARFQATRRQMTARRNALLFSEGGPCEAVFAVIAGAVVLGRANPRGARKAVHLIGPGGTFGFRGLIENRRHRVSAWCGLDSVLCRIPADEAETTFAEARGVEDVFLQDLVEELASTQDRMLSTLTRGVNERLLLLLAGMIANFGAEIGDGWLITTPTNRTDMASLAGMTPETLSRSIRHLQADNLVHFSRRHALIPSKVHFGQRVDQIIGIGTPSVTPC